jgi:hypothetical protein
VNFTYQRRVCNFFGSGYGSGTQGFGYGSGTGLLPKKSSKLNVTLQINNLLKEVFKKP